MSDSTKNWILKEVLPLVVVVGGSVGGSVLWITNELADMRGEIADVRADGSAEIADLRADLSAEIAHLRTDLSAEIAHLRTDLSVEIAHLRTDLSVEIADVRERVASVEGKLDLLISGLDIQVQVPAVPDRLDQPTGDAFTGVGHDRVCVGYAIRVGADAIACCRRSRRDGADAHRRPTGPPPRSPGWGRGVCAGAG